MTDRREPKKMHRLSIVIGAALVIASLGDYLGHLWGVNSPHPAWLPALFLLIGVGLLFPEKIAEWAKVAGPYLPWGKGP